MQTDSMQNPVSMKILQSEKSLQHVGFDVCKCEYNTGVFYNNLHKINAKESQPKNTRTHKNIRYNNNNNVIK